ncbi:MAG: MBL fold metallo-hydrolase, partial [Candidatus Thorarchaeota archaeon]
TDFIPEMEKISEVDVALLPSGDTYTMNLTEAADAAVKINPKIAIPMHLWGKDASAFKTAVESKSSTKVVILKEGEEYAIG